MTTSRSFTTRLSLALALLLLAYGAFVALLGRQLAAEQEQESLQRLSHGLARHIIEHWPEIAVPNRDEAEGKARGALLSMLMTVNPGVQVYLLGADGRVQHYIGEPGMVRQEQVDLAAIRAFLAGAALPLRGTDPMGSGVSRIFSAAMFPVRAGDVRPPGYLYVVLDSPARNAVTAQLGPDRLWQGAALAAAIGLLVTFCLGLFTFRRLTMPLHRLAARLRGYSGPAIEATAPAASSRAAGDEVEALAEAFNGMTLRIESQAESEQRQVADHREMMASVAHDLRTPLTALHGHLEALAGEGTPDAGRHAAVLQAALAQSRKVSRLSQQLFELAALQSTEQVLHRERFSLDEAVTDAVQKFELSSTQPSVTLHGVPPGRLELDGDLQLIERALINPGSYGFFGLSHGLVHRVTGGETPGQVRYNDAKCFGFGARFNGDGVTHVACLLSNPGLLPYGLYQPKPKVLLGVRNHHDACVLRVCANMMRTVDTGKSMARCP